MAQARYQRQALIIYATVPLFGSAPASYATGTECLRRLAPPIFVQSPEHVGSCSQPVIIP